MIYALSVGAVERGETYLREYPGIGGYLLFGACTAAVFMGGGKILDAVRLNRRAAAGPILDGKPSQIQVTAS